jgi:prepilin-type N-terminal cleavage/methylation domain-containing protein
VRARRRTDIGMTLIELLVVLTIIALMASIVTVIGRVPKNDGISRLTSSEIAAARQLAIRSRSTVTTSFTRDGRTITVTALPDGRVIAPPELDLDPRTGATRP